MKYLKKKTCPKTTSSKDELLEILNAAQCEDASIENLQWLPSLRYVYCPNWLLQNIVNECCHPESISIFSIDTTYNVGNYYVTPTTYQRRNIIHKETGSIAHFPGPAMFHLQRTEREFHYFASTLCEINNQFATIRFIGGDRDQAQRKFLLPLSYPRPVYCTKHVKDDISMKLTSLGLNDYRSKYLSDIFGSVETKTQGLVDALTAKDFEERLNQVCSGWNKDFLSYFNTYIKEDMKQGMTRSLLNHLGIETFYNNASECTNKKIKVLGNEHNLEKKANRQTKSLRLSHAEGISVYRKLVQQHQRDLELSILNRGSYQLTGPLAKLHLSDNKYNSMNPAERKRHFVKIDCFHKSPDLIHVEPANIYHSEDDL